MGRRHKQKHITDKVNKSSTGVGVTKPKVETLKHNEMSILNELCKEQNINVHIKSYGEGESLSARDKNNKKIKKLEINNKSKYTNNDKIYNPKIISKHAEEMANMVETAEDFRDQFISEEFEVKLMSTGKEVNKCKEKIYKPTEEITGMIDVADKFKEKMKHLNLQVDAKIYLTGETSMKTSDEYLLQENESCIFTCPKCADNFLSLQNLISHSCKQVIRI